MKIKIGTRGSKLALRQTELVIHEINKIAPECKIEVIKITTKGDIHKNISLDQIGGKGVFVGEFEEALKKGIIDIAVHSAKDLPSKADDIFTFSVLRRENPQDVIIFNNKELYHKIKNNQNNQIFTVGTASPRRKLITQNIYPEASIQLLRGNIDTRLNKLRDKDYDAIIIAKAGISRLQCDLKNLYVLPLEKDIYVPASGQGIIAIETLKNSSLLSLIQLLNDNKTYKEFIMERKIMALLNASCHDAIGIYCQYIDRKYHMIGFYNDYKVYQMIISSENDLMSFVHTLRDKGD